MTNHKTVDGALAFSVLLGSLVGTSFYFLVKHTFIKGFRHGFYYGVSTRPWPAEPSEEYIDD